MNISVSKAFDAPQADVWAVLTDLQNAPNRLSAVKRLEILTDGPVGKGTRFRETRIMFKREATEEFEVTEWNPPTSYALECESCGAHFKSVIACEPAATGGTTLRMSVATRPLTFMARLMSPLGKLMAGSCVKAFKQDLDDIKRAAEASAAQPA